MSTATNRVFGLPVSNVTRDTESLIKHYFFSNFSYSEIIYLLSLHGITISKRHLHRMLRYYKLSRITNKSPMNRVIVSIYNELSSGPNSSFGYRYMHQKLRSKGLVVSRETVKSYNKIIRSCWCREEVWSQNSTQGIQMLRPEFHMEYRWI